jgi:hypothetical protein
VKRRAGPPVALPALLLCLLVLAAAVAGAEQGPLRAVLLRGPYPVKGIPFLPPNLLPAFQGDYALGEQQVSVLFSPEALVLPGEWKSLRCGPLKLAEVPVDTGRTVCLAEAGQEPLFLFFSFAGQDADWCGFVTAFRERFLYLRSFLRSGDEVPFPAFVQPGG